MIREAAEGKSRLFLSHFTSTTHHPWKVPEFYNKTEYMGSQAHKNMNSYLNTIRYVDLWMGEVLGMLDEAGIANETLVVFVGDQYGTPSTQSKTIVLFTNIFSTVDKLSKRIRT